MVSRPFVAMLFNPLMTLALSTFASYRTVKVDQCHDTRQGIRRLFVNVKRHG